MSVFDSAVKVISGTGATDDAAAAGALFTAAGMYQLAPDDVNDGDIGRLRMSVRRGLILARDSRSLSLTDGAPTPSGTDLFGVGAGAIAGTDLAIRDTNEHQISIPMAVAGWRHLTINAYTSTPFDQALTCAILGSATASTFWAKLISFTIPASAMLFGIGEGAVGLGGIAGGATAVLSAYYGCSALGAGWPYLQLTLTAAVAPSAGTIAIHIARTS